MLAVVRDSWALLIGLMLLMLGNGLQGTLLGVRGAMEGFSPGLLSVITSAYFFGLLVGAATVSGMIRRVGHVRVFAALAGLISAAFLIYAAFPVAWVWAVTRLAAGFCFSGVYIVTESWLNDRATNETRGASMSVYMLTQTLGAVAAQGLLTLADPGGYALFVLISVLVSVSVAPMLLTVTPAPAYETARPMTLGALYRSSPLGCVAAFLMGGLFSAMYGMSAVYATVAGFDVGEVSLFVAALYGGGLASQWPIGRLSDKMDRRRVIMGVCVAGAGAAALASVSGGFVMTLAAAAMIGATVNPLYGLVVAHTNDYLDADQMASASARIVFLSSVGATTGPLAVGVLMGAVGPSGFFLFFAALLGALAAYALFRMTQRAAPTAEEASPYQALSPSLGAVAVDVMSEIAAEAGAEDDDAAEEDGAEDDAAGDADAQLDAVARQDGL